MINWLASILAIVSDNRIYEQLTISTYGNPLNEDSKGNYPIIGRARHPTKKKIIMTSLLLYLSMTFTIH